MWHKEKLVLETKWSKTSACTCIHPMTDRRTQEPFTDSVDQDQTAQKVWSYLEIT